VSHFSDQEDNQKDDQKDDQKADMPHAPQVRGTGSSDVSAPQGDAVLLPVYMCAAFCVTCIKRLCS
jgi:hypothetical protein